MLTEREKFDRFVDKHPGVKADAYWWCSGATWGSRWYCVVLVAKSGYKHVGLELRAKTPQELTKDLRAVGYRTTARVVARLCHAAPRSPRRPRIIKMVDAGSPVSDHVD